MKARIVGERQSDVVPAPVPEPKEEATILKYVYWVSDSWYLGYLVDYSDYWT